IKYEGKDVENSNFLIEKSRFEDGLIDIETLKNLDSLGLEKKIESLKNEMMAFYDKNKNIDSSIIATSKNQINPMLMSLKRYVGQSIKLRSELPKGSESPSFEDYENYAGGTTSLKDLKGKFVYVDVWATWCAPCKAEIPSLKKLDEEYKDKNITFVSISIDDARAHKGSMENAHEAWKAMVADKELTGVQLFAPNGWQSDFVEGYKINGIPRFILIDPDGKIVTPDAPRPSDEKLKTLFNSLNI
ncbi:MAG TPA: TlpA family protein disulfide reductase, partial [Flavobacteriaceae bacterium]|nr:TlpA family protein disulfide reductase [Flavobacteriaceae bacterium]